MNFRLATYNIHKFVGNDGKRDVERVLRIIRAMNADILALQEFVLEDMSGNPAGVKAFAAKADYQVIAQPIRRVNGMVQFNLLLTRVPVRGHSLVGLPRNGMEPRGAILAELDIEGRALEVAVTHLALTPGGRLRQLEKLLDLSVNKNDTPFALLADLNIAFPWEPARHLLKRTFPGQREIATYPSRFPVLSLDAIRFRPGDGVRSLAAFRGGDASHASDHLPLIADVALS